MLRDLNSSASLTNTDAGLTPVRGPRFKDKFRAPADVADDSTMSRSSRPTVNQSHFYDGLIARDAFCLVTDTNFESCMAAHILPLSRPEVSPDPVGGCS
ncbi:hypothetical protein BCV69DRAFT_285012 [Microstroma glucosiphilum]|uniref:Uncharacterized protein n=1 Tax=Pseudomicrostroma glucosiphilum TaxID=1684307 RepID=A0A316U5Z9_9BASI|nr:hypothetical protein BCV69DRAFT_285012 [Pseudomicrostroma glucosiphilum]PWN18385.1 hypothetical protein BCV69DRAFT_285012 [Pseudomicrostroma glucosiphilum]